MKKVILTGNLGADAKIIEKSGYHALTFDFATVERHKDNTGVWGNLTEWHTAFKWDKKEYLEKMLPYFKKGVKVLVDGDFYLTVYKEKPKLNVKVSLLELINSPKP